MADDSLTYRWTTPDDQGQGYSDPNAPGAPESVTPSMPASYVNPNLWGAVGRGGAALAGDFRDLAQGLWGLVKTPGEFAEGKYQPGTPEAEAAARNFALTFGLPGAAPAEEGVMSAGVKVPRTARVKPAEGGTLQAPNIAKGSDAPMFDPALKPSTPQANLTRAAPPPKGIPGYVERVTSPENLARVRDRVASGMQFGGEEWYNTEALRHGFLEELGPEQGQKAYEAYINLLGPTSQQTRVPENIRNASYLYHLMRTGKGIPETGPLPYPYGMMDQTLGNARRVMEGGFPLSQPKTASFSQNLMGNYQPYTWDRHISTLWDLRNPKGDIIGRPDPAWYSYLEDAAQREAQQMGVAPAAHQAGGWLSVEGVRSPREPFLATLEDRIRLTAARRGEHPQETYRRFLRGEEPLLQAGDISSAIASSAAQTPQPGDQEGAGP